MSARPIFARCADDCLFETMSKEQILTAIEEALEQGYVSDPDSAVFSKLKEQNAGAAVMAWVGNEAQYNAITEKSGNTLYIVSTEKGFTLHFGSAHLDVYTGAERKTALPAEGTALEDNTEYRVDEAVTSYAFTFPAENFECWVRFATGSTVSITFPTGTKYIGGAPSFEASKTYELSIKDGVVGCAEVVAE